MQRIKKTIKTCYMCNSVATSREHVPPLCLFPEEKDIKVDAFRRNLITVPSCEKHNSQKSSDDEYLMMCIAGIVGNNQIGYFHNITKVKRALDRKDAAFVDYIFSNPKKTIIKGEDGKDYSVLLGSPDHDRLKRCFEHIARGLYYAENKKVFNGKCVVFLGFLKYKEGNFEQIKILLNKMIVVQAKGDHFKTKGANPEIFKYQFSVKDQFGMICVKITFYEGAYVWISFQDKDAKPQNDLAANLLADGHQVTYTFPDGDITIN
jgi:hypothetical protein